MQALNDLQAEGKITAEQYAAAQAAINERFREGNTLGQEVGHVVSSAFGDIITDINYAEAATCGRAGVPDQRARAGNLRA